MYIVGQCMYVQLEVISLLYFSDNILLIKLELTTLAQLCGPWVPRGLLPQYLNARLHLAFTWYSGSKLRSFCFFCKYFTIELPPLPYKPVQRWMTHLLHWVFFLSDNQIYLTKEPIGLYILHLLQLISQLGLICSISPGQPVRHKGCLPSDLS